MRDFFLLDFWYNFPNIFNIISKSFATYECCQSWYFIKSNLNIWSLCLFNVFYWFCRWPRLLTKFNRFLVPAATMAGITTLSRLTSPCWELTAQTRLVSRRPRILGTAVKALNRHIFKVFFKNWSFFAFLNKMKKYIFKIVYLFWVFVCL